LPARRTSSVVSGIALVAAAGFGVLAGLLDLAKVWYYVFLLVMLVVTVPLLVRNGWLTEQSTGMGLREVFRKPRDPGKVAVVVLALLAALAFLAYFVLRIVDADAKTGFGIAGGLLLAMFCTAYGTEVKRTRKKGS
jgi:uncharacterized membrane protein